MTIREWIKSKEGRENIKEIIIHNDNINKLNTSYTEIMESIEEDNIGFSRRADKLNESLLEEVFERSSIINKSNDYARAYLIINGKYTFYPDATGRPTFYKWKEVV